MHRTNSKLIRVGHSPDADDAFMFYALAEGKIPALGFQIEHVVEDIESLNQRALRAELEVTAVSCHAYSYMADQYFILRSGASVGDRYGPILVAPQDGMYAKTKKISPSNIRGKRIAIPGKLTTAYLLLRLFEENFEAVFVPFDQILEAVKSGDMDFGLVIHEGQITYQEEGLAKVLDLGQWWFDQTELPLPLGIDVIRKDLGKGAIQEFAMLFKESIKYALQNREEALQYALQFGRGIQPEQGDRFVAMYVNEYTLDIGKRGEAALQRLFDEGYEKKILPKRITVSPLLLL
ncbi:MAG: ABC transporter substrate-binding protein [Candidatus Omnitrophica bacterium]|nr:ABC transporter substrate-binding protein [Candidatus Omnitrophota bacterium]MDD5670277.1 ABC transporter substrate-binding protein [Candidatus Omnitrophota bacterium]